MDQTSSEEYALDGYIIICKCFIGKKYTDCKIQVVIQCQSTNSTKFNHLIKVLYIFNAQVMT